jgi:hypothetical protein
MARTARQHRIEVLLSDEEHDALRERAQLEGRSMGAVIRSLLGPGGDEVPAAPATRGEAIALLAVSARSGQVTAQIALERALRRLPVPAVQAGPVELGDLSDDELRGGPLRVVR